MIGLAGVFWLVNGVLLYRDVIASLDLVHEIPWGLKSEYLSSSVGIKVLFEPVSLAPFEEVCFRSLLKEKQGFRPKLLPFIDDAFQQG